MRMRSDYYEWLKAFHYYGGVEPKIYGQYLVEKNMKKRGGVRRKRGK